jgi:hypothetical protein
MSLKMTLMIAKRSKIEWMIEPDTEGSREYARLGVFADPDGLNIDGQGVLGWDEIEAARKMVQKSNKVRHAAR